jgi:hypothetical protein
MLWLFKILEITYNLEWREYDSIISKILISIYDKKIVIFLY